MPHQNKENIVLDLNLEFFQTQLLFLIEIHINNFF